MIVMINNKFYNEQEIRQLIQSQAEQIRQLKKMLLQACSDFATLRDNNSVIDCSHCLTMGGCTGCPLDNGSGCKWIYESEALALIGEDTDK